MSDAVFTGKNLFRDFPSARGQAAAQKLSQDRK
jgi:hypothetical protein